MDNQNILHRGAKRRHVKTSSAVQNQSTPRKMVIILDDAWLEALKHLTNRQWSHMSLVCRQIQGIVQRNLLRLPRRVIRRTTLDSAYLHEPSVKRSFQRLLHPVVCVEIVVMNTVSQRLVDGLCNGEERYIRCRSFYLIPVGRMSVTPQKIAKTLEWLERNVRSDSIALPEWLLNTMYESVRDFLAIPVVQGNIPALVIDNYPGDEQYRSQFGENLIDRAVDSQRAFALYEIKNGEKRVRISFRYVLFLGGPYKVNVKFYAV